ncbi:glycosyltransferase [Vicingaceae bacterium]|nr:glycosyltransferase [Vicingaceae bacterium]
MHILILPSEYFITKENPIAGIFQFDQAKIFIEEGNKVGVLAVKPRYSLKELFREIRNRFSKRNGFKQIVEDLLFLLFPIPFAFKKEQKEGINIIRFNGSYGLTRTSDFKGRLEKWKKIGDYAMAKYIKKHGKPDVMHAHNMKYAGMMGNYLSKKYNIPIVLTERSSEHKMKKFPNDLESMISNHFQIMTNLNAVSPSLVKTIEKRYKVEVDKIKWFPNVIDKLFEMEQPTSSLDESKFVFLNVASLIPIKGQEELIKAFDAAFSERDNVILRIVGGGYLRSKLEQLIVDLNLSNRVELTGFKDRNEVVKEMRNCNVLVLPSHHETFGVVLIEALALGKPLIASKCGGPECIVNQQNGFLFDTEDVGGLSVSMQEMKNNYSEYNSLEIRKNLLETFGKEIFYTRIKEIYQKAINDNNY